MTRTLAGVFDPRGRADSLRLVEALAPHPATSFADGPLRLAYSGPKSGLRDLLCLLDGYLDNIAELSTALDVPAGLSPEQLLGIGYRRWGEDLPSRLRGDFALLIWDGERGEGLIARDQLGVRAMFLHEGSGGLCFASEVRHLLTMLPSRPAPDPIGVAHWLMMSGRPGPSTLYAGIRRLDPGAMLLLRRDGVREERYWEPRFSEPLTAAEPELAQRIRVALDRAVARRVGPDDLAAVMMSGGLDSSSVAAVAAAQAPGRVSAYAAVFPDHPAVDESALIDDLRMTLSLSGVTAEVRPGGLLASAVEAVAEWEMPLIGWGDFWRLPLLCAATAAGVGVVLGGDGGDELFGPRSYLMADRLRAGHPLRAVRLARELPGAGYGPGRRAMAGVVLNTALMGALPYRLDVALRRPFAARGMPPWLRLETVRHLRDSDESLAWKRLDGPRWWAEIAHGLTRGVEEVGVFEHQRQSAVSAGLEARHPLFDLDLVELGLRQPPLSTFDPYLSRPVLRAGMAGSLPDSVRLRPQKALFDSLLIDCLAGPDGEATRRLLSDPGAELRAYVDPRAVQRELFDSDRRRRERPFEWMWQVWRLLTAECWLRAQNGGSEALPVALGASPARVDLVPAPGVAAQAV